MTLPEEPVGLTGGRAGTPRRGDAPPANAAGRRSRAARRLRPARHASPPVAVRRAPGRRWWCSAQSASRNAWWGSPGLRPHETA